MNTVTIDGAGNLISGSRQQPAPPVPPNTTVIEYNRRRKANERTDRLAFATLAIFPLNPIIRDRRYATAVLVTRPSSWTQANNIVRYYVDLDLLLPVAADPVVDRVRPQPYTTLAASSAYRIGRYYWPQIIDPTPDSPVDRATVRPYTIPVPSVANRISRYYQPQIIDPVPDNPVDRTRPQMYMAPAPLVVYRIGRYYQPIIFDPVPAPVAEEWESSRVTALRNELVRQNAIAQLQAAQAKRKPKKITIIVDGTPVTFYRGEIDLEQHDEEMLLLLLS